MVISAGVFEAGRRVPLLFGSDIAGHAQALVSDGGVQFLDLVRRRDEVR